MYPFRYRTIFRNRWFALLWAAGIVWWAYDVATSTKADPPPQGNDAAAQQTDAAGESYSDADVNTLSQEMNNL